MFGNAYFKSCGCPYGCCTCGPAELSEQEKINKTLREILPRMQSLMDDVKNLTVADSKDKEILNLRDSVTLLKSTDTVNRRMIADLNRQLKIKTTTEMKELKKENKLLMNMIHGLIPKEYKRIWEEVDLEEMDEFFKNKKVYTT